MATGDLKFTVRIETDVIMDVGLMAKAFADMGSDAQAKFLALVHRAMGEYPTPPCNGGEGTMGSRGRQAQMLSIRDHLEDEPDAAQFIADLYEMTRPVAPSTTPVEEPAPYTIPWDQLDYDYAKGIVDGELVASWQPPLLNQSEDRVHRAAWDNSYGLKPPACPDCGGTGEYAGFNAKPEPCGRCQG